MERWSGGRAGRDGVGRKKHRVRERGRGGKYVNKEKEKKEK